MNLSIFTYRGQWNWNDCGSPAAVEAIREFDDDWQHWDCQREAGRIPYNRPPISTRIVEGASRSLNGLAQDEGKAPERASVFA